MRAVQEKITPDIARRYLEKNKTNRSLRASVVDRFATDMRLGMWKETHQGIAFDVDGQLVDGQHRLSAIVKSETTQIITVTYGVPPESKSAVDNGFARYGVDVLYFAGNSVTKRYSAALRIFLNGVKNTGAGRISNTYLVVQNKKYGESIYFSDNSVFKVPGIGQASVCAAIARAWYYVPELRLQEFCDLLNRGLIGDNKEDRTVIALRDFLLNCRFSTTGSGAQSMIFLKTQRAIDAFARKEVLTKAVSAKDDLFPLKDLI